MGLVDSRLIYSDMHVHQRVATQVTPVVTGCIVGDAVETDARTLADDKCGINRYDRTNGQIQYIQCVGTVRLLYEARVVVGLISRDTIPFERQLVLANSKLSANGIYLIISEIEYRNRVATEAVGAVMEVHTRSRNVLAFPCISGTRCALDSQISGIRTEHVQRQNYHAVTSAGLMEGMTIYAALGECLIAEDVRLTLTDRRFYLSLRDIANGQVQYMYHAVGRSVCGRLRLGVRTAVGIGLAVILPDIGLTRADDYRLLVVIEVFIDVGSDDTVASEHRLIVEYIRTRRFNRTIAIGSREGEEAYALRQVIGRMYGQVHDVQRVDLAACCPGRIVVRAAVIVSMIMPSLTLALTDSVPVRVGVHHVRRL